MLEHTGIQICLQFLHTLHMHTHIIYVQVFPTKIKQLKHIWWNVLHFSIKSHSANTQLHVNLGKLGSYFWEVLTQRGRKTYISFNAQFLKMQQKLPKWAKSIKPCWNEAYNPISTKMFCRIFTQSFNAFWVHSKILKIKRKAVSATGSSIKLSAQNFPVSPWQMLL